MEELWLNLQILNNSKEGPGRQQMTTVGGGQGSQSGCS